jgi:anti-anti-sigma factor
MESTRGTQTAGIKIVALGAEYGSSSGALIGEVERGIAKAIDDCAVGVLIDCDKTTYIGCGFLTMLLRTYKRARGSNRSLFLSTAAGGLARVFAITRFDSVCSVFPSRLHAIRVMAPQRGDDS